MRPHHAPAIRRATRSRLSAFVVLAAALLATTLGIAPAGAESYVVPAPVAPGTTDTILTEVECPSAAVCFAVGGEEVSGTSRSTLLRKDGAAWTRVTVPQPVGATATLLNDISCVSETACWAVGFANVGGVPRPLLVRWNGSAWSLGTPPAAAPGTTSNRLESVHCTAVSSCWAVGYSTSAGPLDRLVMRWNGTSWTRVTPALPPGTTRSLLYGVTCAGASACWAVGQYTTSGDGLLLMMRWNGSTWTPVAAPAPVGSTSTEAYDVSCAGASFCVATGRSYISATNRPLALRWNGSAWSLLTTPVPPGATEGELVDVSCMSATACWAVGYFVKDEYRRMVQRWNGTTWSIGTTPIPTGSVTSGLNGVDCITADDCWAVGDYALAEPVNSSWPFVARLGSVTPPSPLLTPTPIPTGGTESNLEDTDCPTATACWAVGGTQIGSPRRAMVLRSAGNTWGLVNTPSPPGATRSELRGVDCVSTTLCWAVGEATVGGVRRAMIIRWNGTAWSLATPPSIDYSTLDEVSCPTATFCLAVGNKPGGALDAAALVLRWNGATWSEVTTPAPATATYVALLGVSCPTTTSCWAVGLFQTTDTTRRLVLRWNGSSWSIVTTPLPTGTTQSIFFNVSCGSTTSCALVGYGLISGAQTQLLLRWNASTWSIPTAPTPSGATVTALFGVSCPPASACTAVGIAVVGGSARRMVLRGNLGAWSAVSTPLPPGTSTSNFLAASCTTTTTCTFVGSNSIASLTYPLVVRTT